MIRRYEKMKNQFSSEINDFWIIFKLVERNEHFFIFSDENSFFLSISWNFIFFFVKQFFSLAFDPKMNVFLVQFL